LRGSLINDVAALNKVEVAGWYWCDRIKVDPLDQTHDELDASLDTLCRLAATADSVKTVQECFDLYPETATASGRRRAIERPPRLNRFVLSARRGGARAARPQSWARSAAISHSNAGV